MLRKKGMVVGVGCGLLALSGLLWLRHSANEQQAEYQMRILLNVNRYSGGT